MRFWIGEWFWMDKDFKDFNPFKRFGLQIVEMEGNAPSSQGWNMNNIRGIYKIEILVWDKFFSQLHHALVGALVLPPCHLKYIVRVAGCCSGVWSPLLHYTHDMQPGRRQKNRFSFTSCTRSRSYKYSQRKNCFCQQAGRLQYWMISAVIDVLVGNQDGPAR